MSADISSNILFRQETNRDISAIRTVNYSAFMNHPHHTSGAEPTEHLIVDRLREARALSLSLVAERNGVIVGHLGVSPVKINGNDMNWFGIAPVAVLPNFQQQSIGSQLINKSIELTKQQGAAGLVLLGDPAYYHRFGFRRDENMIYSDAPSEYFLSMPFTSNSTEGVVTYDNAFS